MYVVGALQCESLMLVDRVGVCRAEHNYTKTKKTDQADPIWVVIFGVLLVSVSFAFPNQSKPKSIKEFIIVDPVPYP